MRKHEAKILEAAKMFPPDHMDKPMKCYSIWKATINGYDVKIVCQTCGTEIASGNKPHCNMYKETPSNTLLNAVLIGFVLALVSIIGGLYFYEWLYN